jgi:hypothetical protein
MQIRIQDLRQATNLLFDHLLDSGIDQIELTEDYYHVIGEDQLYNMAIIPNVNLVGQLSDDWSEGRGLLKEDSDPLAYDLVHLASLLRYIGEKVVS